MFLKVHFERHLWRRKTAGSSEKSFFIIIYISGRFLSTPILCLNTFVDKKLFINCSDCGQNNAHFRRRKKLLWNSESVSNWVLAGANLEFSNPLKVLLVCKVLPIPSWGCPDLNTWLRIWFNLKFSHSEPSLNGPYLTLLLANIEIVYFLPKFFKSGWPLAGPRKVNSILAGWQPFV